MKHQSTRFDKFSFERPKSSAQDEQNTTPFQQLKTLIEKQKQQESVQKKLLDNNKKTKSTN